MYNNILKKLSTKLQTFLWVIGINWHNTMTDECTSDFRCCEPSINKSTFLRRVALIIESSIKNYRYKKICRKGNKK